MLLDSSKAGRLQMRVVLQKPLKGWADAVTANQDTLEANALPPMPWSPKQDCIALTQALQSDQGKILSGYIDLM